MTRDNNDRNDSDVERLLDAVSSAKEWYNQNKDLFAGMGEVASSMDMDAPEPLTEAHISEDTVKVVAEVRESNVTQIGVGFDDGTMVCEVSDRQFEVEVPDDIDETSMEATMSNGVLEVNIDRTETTEETIDVVTEAETDDTVDELFDDETEGGDEDGADE